MRPIPFRLNRIAIVLLILLWGNLISISAETKEELKNRIQTLEQENWELKNESGILRDELKQSKENEHILEIEKNASDRGQDASSEKSDVADIKTSLEREEKQLLEKRMAWIRRSFYFPGAARYGNGEYGKGILWSSAFFGMVALDTAAWLDVEKKKSHNDVLHSSTGYDQSLRQANFLFFVTGLVYVLNIMDAAYFVKPKPPTQGTVRMGIRVEGSDLPFANGSSFGAEPNLSCYAVKKPCYSGNSFAEIKWSLYF